MKTLAPVLLLGVLAACGQEAPQPAPAPTHTPDAGPRTLVAAHLADIALFARIAGPQGTEVTSELIGPDQRALGQMVSFVACPAPLADDGTPIPPTETAQCDPAAMPPDTIYTYVHTITLGQGDTQAPAPAAQAPTTMVFRMIRPASGFANVIGYDEVQALEALGADAAITVQTEDDSLIWRVTGGDGWVDGETLTFFWQSTLPPSGPEEAYQLRIGEITAPATGPFPPTPIPQQESDLAH